MGKLSENVDNVVEAYGEEDKSDDSETPETPEEKKKRKIAKKFGEVYKKELERAQKVVDKQYSKYVKGRFESLDLMEYATEQLKRFWFTGQCRRNYDQKCPKGWVEYNGSCKAPGDYRGLCNDLKDFTGMGPEEKENFAWRCEAEWPCINGSEQNLKIKLTEKPIFEGVECPFEWAPISETLCLAPKENTTSSGDLRWRRASTKKLNSEKTAEQFEQNKISGIIDDGIIRII
ncbi:Plasmodium falciparum CPW-WPC repeat containing protein [Theileria orientalis strain Shintoku]|uniref:Plasmodium falciparum CPW-WPC repeat containing protein n=1 Tax=Theileria orientalis strain Shintoku TaxID=869250 RepID=J4C482_THEOR|nr:Plasmodium falciparum CPW-WPC repeat containing protein [Theileria orientalis strain Shintoku]BAM41731.1 Plasmodium falciparum CPW-WPC repeat containing protein [Theileria orientalis strain Shintoku]|eukprot:XP_009692032.1 Plasmodium falciparum CPW-WPC repeat containing protein [Theileria orientalis strain Shintoku]